jgi:hypothetical protein
MEKKIISTVVLIGVGLLLQAQSSFDKKLQSLYRNTVPTITSTTLKEYIDSNKKIVLLDTRAH